jgi:methyltransferase (TIGR00027 family)
MSIEERDRPSPQDLKPITDAEAPHAEAIADFVSLSANLMAALRALETERANPLFQDPFAAQLAGTQAIALLQDRMNQQASRVIEQDSTVEQLMVRTRFFDDFLMAATSEAKQVVILAAGMDARAFRLPWADGIRLYELDQPAVLARKAQALQHAVPRCIRHELGVDLTQPWFDQLVEQGYRADLPSVWLLEGLLMYLHEAEVRQLLKTIAAGAAPNSWLGADVLNRKALASKDLAAKYWHWGIDTPQEFFAQCGWEAQVSRAEVVTAEYGRMMLPEPLPDVEAVGCGFWIKARHLVMEPDV